MQSPTSPISYKETSVPSFSKESTTTETSKSLPHANLLTPPTLSPPTITSDLPTSTLSPNHHNYYTHYLNKAQFYSILVNCSINLLKILYKNQKFDEKSIKLFIIEILRRSKTSIQSLQLSCFYIYKLIVAKQKITFDAKKLFLGLIIISSKFNQDYNYSFGVTSKLQHESMNIDELLIKFPFQFGIEETQWLRKTFTFATTPLPKLSIESEYSLETGSWFDYFEKIAFLSVDHSINYEPGIVLTQNYSTHYKYLTNLTTSLVDLSIELFQLVFPYLSTKIQFSLLEQIRNSLTSSSIDPLRLKAIIISLIFVY